MKGALDWQEMKVKQWSEFRHDLHVICQVMASLLRKLTHANFHSSCCPSNHFVPCGFTLTAFHTNCSMLAKLSPKSTFGISIMALLLMCCQTYVTEMESWQCTRSLFLVNVQGKCLTPGMMFEPWQVTRSVRNNTYSVWSWMYLNRSKTWKSLHLMLGSREK